MPATRVSQQAIGYSCKSVYVLTIFENVLYVVWGPEPRWTDIETAKVDQICKGRRVASFLRVYAPERSFFAAVMEQLPTSHMSASGQQTWEAGASAMVRFSLYGFHVDV